MKIFLKSFLTVFITLFTIISQAQECQCLVSEVQNNTVVPCDIVVGTVVTVNSVSTFHDAINQANGEGGNMTILIEDGTYQVASTASYPYLTASNVVIRSASGNRDAVILEGGGMSSTSSTENGIQIVGDNVVIADLTIREVGNHGIQVSGHNLLVHNVRIQNTYEQMIKGSTSETTIDSAIVQCSLFEYTAGIGPQWYIGGLDIHRGNGWIVSDNVFKNIISPSVAVAEHAIHFWDWSSNNIAERNLIINCDRGIGFGLGSSLNEGGIIRNNMIYNDGSGLFNDVGISLETSPYTDVYNNTVMIEFQNAIEYRYEETDFGYIMNNLTNRPIASRDGGLAIVFSNFTLAQPEWFINVTMGDLHLESSIVEVVDQGVDLSEFFTDDLDKNIRPQGDEFDIGADEFLSIVGIESEIEKGNLVQLFPNPSDGIIAVVLDNASENIMINIFDIHGKNVFQKSLTANNSNIDLTELPAGIYFYQVMDDLEIKVSGILILN